MSYERRREDIAAQILDREQIQGLMEPRVPASAKYKTEKADKFSARPDLYPGRKVIFVARDETIRPWNAGEIRGYALGVIVDYYARSGWWRTTTLIVQVTRVSNEAFDSWVGSLRAVTLSDWERESTHLPALVPEEAGPKNFHL